MVSKKSAFTTQTTTKLTLLIVSAVLLIGCSATKKDTLWAQYNPSFEVDDIKDGIFPNKSTRVGEHAYYGRVSGGMKHELSDDTRVKWGAGMRNQHVGELIFEIEKDI